MNLDIRTGVLTAFILALLGVIILGFTAYRTFKAAKNLPYFRKRRVMLSHAWRLVFVALFWGWWLLSLRALASRWRIQSFRLRPP